MPKAPSPAPAIRTATDCEIGFDEIDTNRDGAIGFDEFHAWWTRG